MSLMKWNPFKHVRKVLKKNYPEFDLPRKSWEVQVDVYGEKENSMVEMNLQGIDPLKTNFSLKDQCLLIGDREDSIEETERIISLPRPAKKIVLTAVLNIA